MILGVYGAARMDELVNLQFTDVASDGVNFVVTRLGNF